MKLQFIIVLLVLVIFGCKEKTQQYQVEIRDGFLNINGSDIYYKTMGSGEPLFIIHGGPLLDHSYLLPHFEVLAKDHQLIFYDQRVCGKSSMDIDTATMTLQGFVNDIELIRKVLKFDQISILGHSWGGLLAMHYAINYQPNLNSVILSNSIPASSDQWANEEKEIAQKMSGSDSLKRLEILTSGEMKEDPSSAITKLMMLAFKVQFYDTTKLDQLKLNIPANYPYRGRIFQRLAADLMSYNLYDQLSSLSIPTLIIYGEIEPAYNLSGAYLNEAMQNAQLVAVQHAGHFPFIENPQLYFESINVFLNTVPEG